jgi:hypothetical protein
MMFATLKHALNPFKETGTDQALTPTALANLPLVRRI